MDVSDRRMQVQLTRKFCLRQNLSPRRLDLTIPKGSANPPPEAKIVSDFFLSEQFLRLWALSALWEWREHPCD